MDKLSVPMNVDQHVDSLVKVLGEFDQINLCETTIIGFKDVLNGCEKLHSSDIVDFSHLREAKFVDFEAPLRQPLQQVYVKLGIGSETYKVNVVKTMSTATHFNDGIN